MSELTLSRLKEVLKYNRRTGIFTNRITRGPRAVKGAVAGYTDSEGYIVIGLDGKAYGAHRLAWFYIHGKWPPADIDHKNRVKYDNRIKNLRPATNAINSKNQKLYKNSTTGVCGVTFDKTAKKHRAQIRVDGGLENLGYYDTLKEATKARKKAEKKHGFHPNHGLTKKQRAKR